MTNFDFANTIDANTNVQTEDATVDAGASSDAAAHATQEGGSVSGLGGAHADVTSDAASAGVQGDTALDGVGSAEGVAGHGDLAGAGSVSTSDVSAAVDGSLDGAAGATQEGASGSFEGALHGMLDAMGDLVAHVGASISGLFGL